jgi:hypothetical protein
MLNARWRFEVLYIPAILIGINCGRAVQRFGLVRRWENHMSKLPGFTADKALRRSVGYDTDPTLARVRHTDVVAPQDWKCWAVGVLGAAAGGPAGGIGLRALCEFLQWAPDNLPVEPF